MNLGTVVTTVFNGSQYISRYCDVVSAARENGLQLRWLVLDDGSTDGTPNALRQELERRGLADRVEVAELGRLGRARALNASVKRVYDPIFYIHDFDDVSFPSRFKAQFDLLNLDESIACVGGGYVHVDSDTGREETRAQSFSHDRFLSRFPLYVPFPHTFMAFRTQAVRDVGGYPTWDDYEEMGLIAALLQRGWRLDATPELVGRHYIYRQSFFERQHGFARRRWRNFKRQLLMKREFPIIRISSSIIVARFLYNFLPSSVKSRVRKAAQYAD
jgi:glycosyltransferase involved in cell wall biosynthesis